MKATTAHITAAEQIVTAQNLTHYDWTIDTDEVQPHILIAPDAHLVTGAPLLAISLGGIDTYPIRTFMKQQGFRFEVDRKWRRTFSLDEIEAASATVKQLMRIKALQAGRLAVYPKN